VEQFNIQSWLKRGFLLTAILSILVAMGSLPSWAIVVTTTADSGAGSLREAINTANGDGVATPITFDPAGFPDTIVLATELPPLTDPGDTIDGTGTGVVIDGSAFPPGGGEIGLRVQASNITIRGLTIQNFDGHGIRVGPPSGGGDVKDVVISHNVLQDNGNSVSGNNLLVSAGNAGGSKVTFSVSNNELSRSGRHGIFIRGGDVGNDKVSGAISNNEVKNSGGFGIFVRGGNGDKNKVSSAVFYNEVEGSGSHGIFVSGGDGSNNKVSGNISKNKVENSIRRGIFLSDGNGANNIISFANITDNESNNNGDDGIFIGSGIPGSGATLVSGNQANNNDVDGIQTSSSSTGYVLVANEANNNGGRGIRPIGNVDGGGNTASGNGSCNTPGCF